MGVSGIRGAVLELKLSSSVVRERLELLRERLRREAGDIREGVSKLRSLIVNDIDNCIKKENNIINQYNSKIKELENKMERLKKGSEAIKNLINSIFTIFIIFLFIGLAWASSTHIPLEHAAFAIALFVIGSSAVSYSLLAPESDSRSLLFFISLFFYYYGLSLVDMEKAGIILSFFIFIFILYNFNIYFNNLNNRKKDIKKIEQDIKYYKNKIEKLDNIIKRLEYYKREMSETSEVSQVMRGAENVLSYLRSLEGDCKISGETQKLFNILTSKIEYVKKRAEAIKALQLFAQVLEATESVVEGKGDLAENLHRVEDLCSKFRGKINVLNIEELKDIYEYARSIEDANLCSLVLEQGFRLEAAMAAGLENTIDIARRELTTILTNILRKYGKTYLYQLALALLQLVRKPVVVNVSSVESETVRDGLEGLGGIEKLLTFKLNFINREPHCKTTKFTINGELLGLHPENLRKEWNCCLTGCGGWGCVYKCTDNNGTTLAFKISSKFREAFENSIPAGSPGGFETSIKALMKLNHPNILKLVGYGTELPLLIYEYAPYGSLSWQLSQAWKPTVKDILLVGLQVGDALRYLHSRGLVHGDIKPGNILVSQGMYSLLGDLTQISALLLQSSGQILSFATPGWRAPEQVYPEIKRKSIERGLESRVDVYQLGNLLLYLATGTTLDGEYSLDSGFRRRVLEALKGPLRDPVMRALEAEPWRRPGSEEFVRMLYFLWHGL